MPDIPRRVLDMLAEVPLFSGLSRKELDAVARLGSGISAEDGQQLTRQGARGAEAFLIEHGTARCLVGDTEIAALGEGDFFGEMSLLDGAPRSATVVADGSMDVVVFTRAEFLALIEASPKIAVKMLTKLAARIRTLDKLVTNG